MKLKQNNYFQRINKYLENYFNINKDNILKNNISYSVLAGGKRFRPMLTYSSAHMYGVNLEQADPCACAIEFIHIYSLIHDDLPAMDNDDIRNNQPANHKKFNEGQAIVAGDCLQAMAFSVLVNSSYISSNIKINLIKELSLAAFNLTQGQSIDLSISAKSTDIESLSNMYRKKTGALLKCAIFLGAKLNPNLSIKDEKILDSFAQNIGLAYQIQDDIFDAANDNKFKQSKHIQVKNTFPSLLGMNDSIKFYKSLYYKSFDEIKNLSVDAKPLIELTQSLLIREF